jgi:hypothetical protein
MEAQPMDILPFVNWPIWLEATLVIIGFIFVISLVCQLIGLLAFNHFNKRFRK